MLTIALATLLALQEDVEKQAARVTEKDSRASFDALSRLADLAGPSRAAVEKGAGTMPAFYREALLEELRMQERMGDKCPKLKRLSLDIRNQAPLAVFTDLNTQHGDKLQLSFLNPRMGGQAGANLTLRAGDVTFMEALDAVCRESKSSLMMNGWRYGINPHQPNVASFAYRNVIVQVGSASRQRKVEFGAGETRSYQLSLQIFWDIDAPLLQVVKGRVTEALDSAGGTVAVLPPPVAAPEAEPARNDASLASLYPMSFSTQEVQLAVPKGDTIRVRGWYDVLVAGESSLFEFAPVGADAKKADERYALEVGKKN